MPVSARLRWVFLCPAGAMFLTFGTALLGAVAADHLL
jgi:hypothetical protein